MYAYINMRSGRWDCMLDNSSWEVWIHAKARLVLMQIWSGKTDLKKSAIQRLKKKSSFYIFFFFFYKLTIVRKVIEKNKEQHRINY